VIVTYKKPLERVLFNEARDANPFFHMFEAMWMLSGRNEVAPLAYYSSNIAAVASDDGKTFNGAYGYRWRAAYGGYETDGYNQIEKVHEIDQLNLIIDHLRRKPESRRAVLQMWNVEDDLLKIDETKDTCCNLSVMFSIRNEYRSELDGKTFPNFQEAANWARELGWTERDIRRNEGRYFLYREGVEYQVLDMTVTNRSNDLIWGMLGANVVHFSFLQEYIACALGIEAGTYNQFTNNLHVYLSNWKPKQWLNEGLVGHVAAYPESREPIPLVRDKATFDQEVNKLVDCCYDLGDGKGFRSCSFTEPFLKRVAVKMCMAYLCYKRGEYQEALKFIDRVEAADWRVAGREWIARRLEKKGIDVGS
jgi:thymidylate synthase